LGRTDICKSSIIIREECKYLNIIITPNSFSNFYKIVGFSFVPFILCFLLREKYYNEKMTFKSNFLVN